MRAREHPVLSGSLPQTHLSFVYIQKKVYNLSKSPFRHFNRRKSIVQHIGYKLQWLTNNKIIVIWMEQWFFYILCLWNTVCMHLLLQAYTRHIIAFRWSLLVIARVTACSYHVVNEQGYRYMLDWPIVRMNHKYFNNNEV